MPLDYRLAMAAPQERFGTLKDIMAIGQLHDQDRQQQQARIDAAQQAQADQIIQQTLTQFPDKPDEAVNALKQRGMHKAAMSFESYLAEHRKKLAETAKVQAETKIKELEATGQTPDQLLKSSIEFAKNANPDTWAPFLVAAADNGQEAWDAAVTVGTSLLGSDPRAKTILATIPKTPDKAWAQSLLGAKDAQKNAPGAGTDYAQFLARYAAGLNKKPEQLTAEEELKAKQEFSTAGRAAGGEGTPFEVFLADQMAGEAAKLGKTPQELGPSWRAGQSIKARKLWEAANDSPQGGAGGGAGSSNAKDIANAIKSGLQPPDLTGLYGLRGPIQGELARSGYDLTRAIEDWKGTQKYLQTLNGAQQTRLRQAVTFTKDSLDIVQDLANQWDGGKFPLLNRAQLMAAKNGALGPKAQSIATQMNAQISDLVSELGTVYKGGNSSTDESLKLAAENLKSDWSKKTMTDAIALIRKNLTIRENSIKFGQPIGGREDNPYAPVREQPAAAPAAQWVFDPATGKLVKKGGG